MKRWSCIEGQKTAVGEAATLNNIGDIYESQGEMQEALEKYNEALPLYRVIGERSGEAYTLTNTRDFMYAGAPRVVASLWKVDDRATSELMKRFYQGMLGPEALRPAGASRQAPLSI
jgi:hypothetical protein